MRNRAILAILIFASLLLGLSLRINGASDQKRKQSLSLLEKMPKSERDRFDSNAFDFYRHNSKPAREERKRLRTLYNQIQNDPECEHLTKTMGQYVEWVNRMDNPAKMREIQGRSIEERVETIKKSVQEESLEGTGGDLDSADRLRERIRENLPLELRDFSFPALLREFDNWLTAKYAEEKAKLSQDQLTYFPKIENLYESMFRSVTNETTSSGTPAFAEKLALIQLIQQLENSPRSGLGGPGGGPWQRSAALRDEFLNSLENDLQKLFDQIDAPEKQRILAEMPRPARQQSLQRLLAFAILDQYPMLPINMIPRSPNSGRSSSSQLIAFDDQQAVDILGTYLAVMPLQRRNEILKMDPRFSGMRLRWELLGNAAAINDLVFFYDRPGGRGPGGPGGSGAPGGEGRQGPQDGQSRPGGPRGPVGTSSDVPREGRGEADVRGGRPI